VKERKNTKGRTRTVAQWRTATGGLTGEEGLKCGRKEGVWGFGNFITEEAEGGRKINRAIEGSFGAGQKI